MSQGAGNSSSGAGGVPPPAAAPPSRSEIERKLSFKSAARPTPPSGNSPKKDRKPNMYLSTSQMHAGPSGNDSDTSSIASSSQFGHGVPQSPGQATTPSLSAIAERKGSAIPSMLENFVEEEGEEEEDLDLGEDPAEGSGSDDDVQGQAAQGDLARGMEGERMVKSGYLWKKQERRKAWKKKWFVLRTGKVAYYKDDREYSLKRVIELKSIHAVAPVTVKKHSFAFGIVTSKRTFLVKASSPDEMEDWVRAMNGCRRKLSEQEEEDRNKREGKTAGMSMPIPARQQVSENMGVETHQGTYSSVFTNSTSISSSPIATTGYFAPKIPSTSNQQTPIPSSPLDTTNTLTAQMARVAIPRTPSMSTSQGRSTSARRDPSASSISSDYLSRSPQPPPVSSDEDEPYFSDPHAGLGSSVGTTPVMMSPASTGMGNLVIDPKKIILSAYLMKRSKGRGKKVWKKRWFFLTSQGLTYTKSHMDSRPLRHIPLTSVLDALDFESGESSSDAEDSDNSPSIASSVPTRQFSQLRQGRSKDGHSNAGDKTHPSDDHTFRIVTAKRTFVLCAPSEEDEIKWLAAFRALLNRERWGAAGVTSTPIEAGSSAASSSSRQPVNIPFITAQPPTPASQLSVPAGQEAPPTPASSTSQGPPQWDRTAEWQTAQPTAPGGGAPGLRGRSATFNAKSAVADVVRRYHPEQAPSQQGPGGSSAVQI